MEQDRFNISVLLSNDRILLPINSANALLWRSWDEARHCNADWELHVILQGTCHIDVEDDTYHLQANQAILIAPGQYHRPKAQSTDFSRFTVTFSVLSQSLRQRMSGAVPVAKVIDADKQLCDLVCRMAEEREMRKPYARTAAQATATLLMVQLMRTLGLEEAGKPVAKAVKGKDLTPLIDEYFEQNFAAAAGEEDLARWLHLSRRQLVRILQETYGMTYRQKLIHTRMDYAGWLLRTTDMKVSQIGGTVGYTSEAAFFQVFRKHYGLSPMQYRLQKKGASK